MIEAGIHAREWVAPATALYTLYVLLTSKDANIKKLVQNFDWYIVPVVNVDGYVYTHTRVRMIFFFFTFTSVVVCCLHFFCILQDRLWRKNCRRASSLRCRGTDLNRNFDIHFGGK